MKFLNNLDLSKNQIMNAILHLLSGDPTGQAGQIYYNTTDNRPKVHNGTSWLYLLASNLLGVNNGIASLDGNGKIPVAQLPDSILGQLEYQGVWDASGGAAPGSPSKGFYWVISVAGTISAVPYAVGDWLVHNGTTFDKVDNTDAVTMVAGRTGNIVLTTADVAASTNKNYVTDAQATVITNTSGTNSGNETATTIGSMINGATAKATPVDADNFGYSDSAASNVLKKFTFANMKAALKTYFDTVYNNYTHPTGDGNIHVPANGTGNSGKFLQASGTAGVYSWQSVTGGATKYSVAVGNGVLTSCPVTHNLNTRAVVVTVFETSTPYAEVLADVEHTDLNNVTIKFAVAPTASQYTVVVIG